MTSSVYFKMHHGNEVLAVNFTGHQIKLLDLKRSIMELKNISKGLDFDLKITDAENEQKSLPVSSKHSHSSFFPLVYQGDDSFVPKNTTVVVKRIPVPQGTGLLTRLSHVHRGHSYVSNSHT
jgi:hypothetical protein